MWRRAYLEPFDIRKAFVRRFKGHTDIVTGIVVNQGILYSSSLDQTVKVWKITRGTAQKTYNFTTGVTSIALNNGFLFAGLQDGSISQLDLSNDQINVVYQNHTSAISCLYSYKNFIFSGS